MSGDIMDLASGKHEEQRYVMLINHENPYVGRGGTERYITNQTTLYRKQNIDVLVLFPLDLRAILGIPFIHGWGVVENCKFNGIKSVQQVVELINNYNEKKVCAGVYIHNIIDLDIDELYTFVSFRNKITLFIHDYCTCCKQVNLRKNRNDYCGDSRLYKEKCNGCRFFEQSKLLHTKLEDFFEKIPMLRIIAPSTTAAELWIESYPMYKEKVEIVPHLIPEGDWHDERGEIQSEEAIRVAFIGTAMPQKGWDIFENAVKELNKTKKAHEIKVYYLGQSRIRNTEIMQIYVSTHEKGDNAMIDALRNNKIDAVVLFSNWPETYSFTYYESLAANCFVITNKLSGNIAKQTNKRGNGIIIKNESKGLTEVFLNPELLREKINQYRTSNKQIPLTYKNNIQATVEIEGEKAKKISYNYTSSNISAKNADFAYRIRYSSFFSRILPVYIAPKETADRIMKSIKRLFD